MKDILSNTHNLGENIGNGEIMVISVLECEGNELLEGLKINLYKISGLSPILIETKITDKEGKVIFQGVENGCYRVIEIINKHCFEKPKYVKWNEFTIDDANKKQKVIIINKIKKSEV